MEYYLSHVTHCRAKGWHKPVLIMKLCLILLLATCMQVSAKSYGQNDQHLSLSLKEATLAGALAKISHQSHWRIIYSDDIIPKGIRVNLKAHKQSLADILDIVLEKTDLQYEMLDNHVIVIRSKAPLAHHTLQQNIVEGMVSDETGHPMAGVSVKIKGTNAGVVTNPNGQFKLNANAGDSLIISYVGYQSQSVSVEGQTALKIVLTPSVSGLNQVVVIGYGSQKKKDITSAISEVSTSDIKERPIVTVGEAITGKAAGVQVVQPSGKPGRDMSVLVRGVASLTGNTQPLYVIDGVVSYDTHGVDPNSIESISVLKDAAAAGIYGAAGSTNGVVLITTKKGTKGAPKVAASAYYGTQSISKKLDMLNGSQLADLLREEQANAGNNNFEISDSLISSNNNNWQDIIYRNAPIFGVNTSFSGGGEKGTYYFGAGYVDQKGIVISSKYKRYSVNINLEQQMTDWLSVGTHFAYNRTNYSDIPDNQRSNYGGAILSALTTPPFSPIYNPNGDGTYGTSSFSQGWANPLGDIYGSDNRTVGNNIVGEGHLEIKLPFEIKYRSQFGINLENSYQNIYQDPRLTTDAKSQGGVATYNSAEAFRYIWDNTLTYNKKLGNSLLDIVAGTSASKQHNQSTAQSGFGFPSYAIHELSAASNYTVNQTFSDQWTLASYFARVNFTYDDKYLLTGSIRRDGSSRFGINDQWATFPAFSAGWRISNESFMKDVTFINDLKLRAGWGVTGNLPADFYPSFSQLGIGHNYSYDGTDISAGTVPSSQAGNPDLKWEETKQYDIGLDVSVLDNLLTLSADYYNKRTNGLILNVQQPLSTGISTIEKNLPGHIQNKGFEFIITGNLSRQRAVNWTTSYNMSFNRTKVSLPEGTAPILTGYIQDIGGYAGIVKAGLPLGAFWGYIDDGVDPETGNIEFRDLNGDHIIDPDNDRAFLGSALPKFNFGFSNNLSYKNFDLNILITGVYGNKIFNATRMELESMTELVNQSASVLDRWQKPGDITDIPRAVYGNGTEPNTVPNYSISSRWVESGSYLKVGQITLAYNLNGKWLDRTGIKSIRPYVTLQNMITLTGYKGYSPELNATSNYSGGSNNATQMGFDHGTYPQAKGITFGLNVSL